MPGSNQREEQNRAKVKGSRHPKVTSMCETLKIDLLNLQKRGVSSVKVTQLNSQNVKAVGQRWVDNDIISLFKNSFD